MILDIIITGINGNKTNEKAPINNDIKEGIIPIKIEYFKPKKYTDKNKIALTIVPTRILFFKSGIHIAIVIKKIK